MPTHTMKLAKTSKEEINALNEVLNEVEWLHKELHRSDFDSVAWEDFDILGKFRLNSPEEFLEDLVAKLSGIHFHRILMNCMAMLDHCADPDQDTLEYNPDIAKGLELLATWVNEEPGRRRDFPVRRVYHAALEPVGDSAHTSQCPACTPGTLVLRRDESTLALQAEDACLYCGQRFVYMDVKDGLIVEQQAKPCN